MTAHPVYVCRVCSWVSVVDVKSDNQDQIAKTQASAHVTANPGHAIAFHRVKMGWEIG